MQGSAGIGAKECGMRALFAYLGHRIAATVLFSCDIRYACRPHPYVSSAFPAPTSPDMALSMGILPRS